LQPDVVILDVGTNDLDNGLFPPNVLADILFRFAESLQQHFKVRHIVILEVFFRTELGQFAPRSPGFNASVRQFNNKCKFLSTSKPLSERFCHFWHHSGMVANWQQYIVDGVHLTQIGLSKYYRSVRSAIIRYSSMSFYH